jgi:meiotic recombination protein SPO11
MLRRELPVRWKRELMHMLFTRRKAETEVLSSVRNPDEPHPLVRYLGDRILEAILDLSPTPEPGLQLTDGVLR